MVFIFWGFNLEKWNLCGKKVHTCTVHFCFKAAIGFTEVSGIGKNYFLKWCLTVHMLPLVIFTLGP